MKNIVLIGMAGSGKSTLGRAVATKLKMSFVDTDALIEEHEGRKLQPILDDLGCDGFIEVEEKVVSAVKYKRTVISTGGSVVYSDKAMKNLKKNGVVVYIYSPFDEVNARLGNLASRGVVIRPGFTLEMTYDEREPLYRKYADIVLDSSDNVPIDDLAVDLEKKLKDFGF